MSFCVVKTHFSFKAARRRCICLSMPMHVVKLHLQAALYESCLWTKLAHCLPAVSRSEKNWCKRISLLWNILSDLACCTVAQVSLGLPCLRTPSIVCSATPPASNKDRRNIDVSGSAAMRPYSTSCLFSRVRERVSAPAISRPCAFLTWEIIECGILQIARRHL